MDLAKTGSLLCDLRKAKGMTQKQVAEKLNVLPKTVSKWETGRGFPDVSTISTLAELFGVSEKIILSGNLVRNAGEAGNIKKMKFYVCPCCDSIVQGLGNAQPICCGKPLEALEVSVCNEEHKATISEIEDDFYVEFEHPMTKEHFISFVVVSGFDRTLFIRLYPEQAAEVRFPRMGRAKIFFCCSKDGLFELKY